jgi:outer membrane lipoprotein SlyB
MKLIDKNRFAHFANKIANSVKKFLVFGVSLALVACYPANNRVITQPAPGSAAAKSNAALTQVYFYPKAGQSNEQQSRDHYDCYNWAVTQTGFDPGITAMRPEQRVKVVPMPPPGHDTITLSIVGAVLGALVGGPRHAAGGALIGASAGAVAGAASDISRQESARQMEEAYYNRDQALNSQLEAKALDFRRAMGACLEGRGYSVK